MAHAATIPLHRSLPLNRLTSVCLDVCMVYAWCALDTVCGLERCVCVTSLLASADSRAARLKPERTLFSQLILTLRL